jgi:hypothetical protein
MDVIHINCDSNKVTGLEPLQQILSSQAHARNGDQKSVAGSGETLAMVGRLGLHQ